MPSRTWLVAQITAIGAFLVALINSEWDFSNDLQIIAVGIVVAAIGSYLIPDKEKVTQQ